MVANRYVRVLAVGLGVWVGLSIAGLGYFLGTVPVGAVAGLFAGAGAYLYVPPVLAAAGVDGAAPAGGESDVLGTGVHRGTAGVGLAVAGLATIVAGIAVERSAAVPVLVGVVVGAVAGFLVRVVPTGWSTS